MLTEVRIKTLHKIKWFIVTSLIFGGTVYSVTTGREWPPFSPYPMYSSPVSTDELIIYRVVAVDTNDIDLQKKILSINTTRTISTILSSRAARRYSWEKVASSLLEYYDSQIKKDEKFKDKIFKLRIEKVVFSYLDIKLKIDDVAKAQTWDEMDQVLTSQKKILYEK